MSNQWLAKLQDETIVPVKIKKGLNQARLRHLDDLDELRVKYMAQSLTEPYGYQSEEAKKKFWAEFTALGHDNLESMSCKCCGGAS